MSRTDDRTRDGGVDIVVGLLLCVAAIVFHARYGGGTLALYDAQQNYVDLVTPLEFLFWTLALASIIRGVLRVDWTRPAGWLAQGSVTSPTGNGLKATSQRNPSGSAK